MRLLLIAHGSRDPRSAESFETLCRRLQKAGHLARAGYLELCGPGVAEAAATLAGDCDADEPIVAVPMFLNHGYHVAHDVPGAVAAARAELAARDAFALTASDAAAFDPASFDAPAFDAAAFGPAAQILVAAPLGPDPLLIEAMDSRLRELGVWPGDPETAVVLASAGTSDRAARAVLEDVAARWAETGWHSVTPAYAAAADPDVATAVASARERGARNVVIASYFLAPGLLADRVALGAPGVSMAAPFATPVCVEDALPRLVLRRAEEALLAAGYGGELSGHGGRSESKLRRRVRAGRV